MNRFKEVLNLIAVGSIEEYRVVDGPELRLSGKKPTSPWSYPARGFAAWGHQRDAQVVLPYIPAMTEFTEGLRGIWAELGVVPSSELLSPIWVEDPLIGERDALDHVIRRDLDDVAAQLYPYCPRFEVVPHAYTPELGEWTAGLKSIFGLEIGVSMSPKPYNYPNIFDRSGFSAFARKYNLPIPYSVTAVGKESLLQAYEEVFSGSGVSLVWVKLAASGGGYGVVHVENENDVSKLYDHFKLLGVLNLYGKEIPWEVQANVPNISALCSWQYRGPRIITPGSYSIQFMDPDDTSAWIGNGYNFSPAFLKLESVEGKIKTLQSTTMHAMHNEMGEHNFTGGYDFAVTQAREGEATVVILEHNGARMSDAVLQSEAAAAFGIGKHGQPFIAIKLGKPHCGIRDVWTYLKDRGFAYSPTAKRGTVPFTWLNSETAGYATLFIAEQNEGEIMKMYGSVVGDMRKEGII